MPRPARVVQMVRLGVPPAIARNIGVEAFVGAGNRMDGIALQIADGWTSELLHKLHHGELDFVIGYAIAPTDRMRLVDLVEDRFIFAVSPQRAGSGARISLDEALQSDLVFYGEKSAGWNAWMGATQSAGLSQIHERHVESIDIWRSLLCRGLGTSITSLRAIVEEYEHGDLVIREIDGPPITRRIGLAFRNETETKFWATEVVDFLTELLQSVQTRLGNYSRVLSIAGAAAAVLFERFGEIFI
jgi:DNA-binding transcriptional LysR family regulator